MRRIKLLFAIGLFTSFFFTTNLFVAQCSAEDKQLAALSEFLNEPKLESRKYPDEYPPELFENDGLVPLLERGIREFEDPKQINLCFTILAEKLYQTGKPALVRLANEDQIDQDIRLQAIHLLTLYRDREQLPLFESFLDHEEAAMRAAGIDAIGYLRQPPRRFERFEPVLSDNPKLSLNQFVGNSALEIPRANQSERSIYGFRPSLNAFSEPTNSQLRKRFVDMMLNGKTAIERQAAARALVEWTDGDYQMRVAEWGVWIADSDNNFQLVKSVLDEIPDFATRTQNLVSELKDDRVMKMQYMTKPVVQINASEAISIDLTVDMRMGQIWFAYPRPSDFHLLHGLSGFPKDEGLLTVEKLAPFRKTLKEHAPKFPERFRGGKLGYPWLKYTHKIGDISGAMGVGGNGIKGVGLTWENLVVSPKRNKDWMRLEMVPEKKRWWSDLREVKSDWISNGKETERFLYYDGPTIAQSPIDVTSTEKEIAVIGGRWNVKWKYRPLPFDDPCQLMLIQVKDGKFRASFQRSHEPIRIHLSEIEWLSESDSLAAFDEMVGSYAGLTPNEAAGLLRAWKPQFFETDGTRLIVRMNQSEYDALFPLYVRPEPTEVSRVGLVLYELDKELPGVAKGKPIVKATRKFEPITEQNRESVTQRRRELARARYLIRNNKFDEIANCSTELRSVIYDVVMTTPYAPKREEQHWRSSKTKHKDVYSALFADDKKFKHRNEFLRRFSTEKLPFDSVVYTNSHYSKMLGWCMNMIDDGAVTPPSFAKTVALDIVMHRPNIRLSDDDERIFDRLISPALKKVNLDSDTVSQIESELVERIQSVWKWGKIDVRGWTVTSRLLPPETNSRLLRQTLKLAKAAESHVPKSDWEENAETRKARLVKIAGWIAPFVDRSDLAEFEKLSLGLGNLKFDGRDPENHRAIVDNLRKPVPTAPTEPADILDEFLKNHSIDDQRPSRSVLAAVRSLDKEAADKFADRILETAKIHRTSPSRVRKLIWMTQVLRVKSSSRKFVSDYLEYGRTFPEGAEKSNFLCRAVIGYRNASEEDKSFMQSRFIENLRQTQGAERLTVYALQRRVADSLSDDDLVATQDLIDAVPDDESDESLSRKKRFAKQSLVEILEEKRSCGSESTEQ